MNVVNSHVKVDCRFTLIIKKKKVCNSSCACPTTYFISLDALLKFYIFFFSITKIYGSKCRIFSLKLLVKYHKLRTLIYGWRICIHTISFYKS